MARTKQTAHKPSTSSYKPATFKKKKKRQPRHRRGSGGGWWRNDDRWGLNYRHRMYGPGMLDEITDFTSDDDLLADDILDLDDMGHDDLDDEVNFGKVRGNIVGLQYYHGTVNPGEYVGLEREPNNKYDINAIRVKNVSHIQIGHIKRELARPLAFIVDKGMARIEGIIPNGLKKNTYSLPIDLHLWGKPEGYKATVEKLKFHGFYLTGGVSQTGLPSQSGAQSASGSAAASFIGNTTPTRTIVSTTGIKCEVEKLFEDTEDIEKTKCAEPTDAIITPLYPHQKQALNWMISCETGTTLPPFWIKKSEKRYYNAAEQSYSNTRPKGIRGGILADDMGLGKTLEMITLIVSNFVDGQPLACPVPGVVRQTKQERMAAQKAKLLPTSESVNRFPRKKIQLKLERVESSSCHQAGGLHPVLGGASSEPRFPMLPRLLEVDHISMSSSSSSEEDSDEEEVEEENSPDLKVTVMTKKEDPDFSPLDKSVKKSLELTRGRPKRVSKRPMRYVYSSEEDEIINEETPKKKGKTTSTIKGKGAIKGQTAVKGLGKCLNEVDTSEGDAMLTQSDQAVKTSNHTCDNAQQSTGHMADSKSSVRKTYSDNCDIDHTEPGCDQIKLCDTVIGQKEAGGETSSGCVETKTTADAGDNTDTSQENTAAGTICDIKKSSENPSGQEIGSEDELPDLDSPVQEFVRSQSIGTGDDLPDLDDAVYIVKSETLGVGDDLPDLDISVCDTVTTDNMDISLEGNSCKIEPCDAKGPSSFDYKSITVVKISDMKMCVYKAVALELEKQSDRGKPYWQLMADDIDMAQELQKEIAESKKPGMEFLDKIDEQGYTSGKLGIFCKVHGIAEAAAAGVFGEYPPQGQNVINNISLKGKSCKTEPCDAKGPSNFDHKSITSYGTEASTSETVLVADYSKPSTLEMGPSTGRAITEGPRTTLIVCPMSVISNWLGQLEEHVHRNVHLAVYLYYGQSRTRDSKVLEKQDVVITTYSTVAADFKKSEKNALNKVPWLRVVLDEGHMIKNPNALQTKAILQLNAQRKWVLTGTPIQNSMKDLWSLINFLKVEPFTDRRLWMYVIERPFKYGHKTSLENVQHLMSRLSLRRTKTQRVNGRPLVDLPARNVYIESIQLTTEERAVYEAMQKEGRVIVSRYCKEGTLLHNYSQVLAILLRLRQICCHPFLVSKAARAMREALADLESAGGTVDEELRQKLVDTLMMVLSSGADEECAVCLDSLKSPVITHCAHVYCRQCIENVIKNEQPNSHCPLCRADLDQSKLLEVTPEQLQGKHKEDFEETIETWKSSAKADALMTALLKLRAEDSSIKSIIVSQFTSLLSLLEMPLRTNGFTFVRLNGTMNTKARMEAMREFSDTNRGSPTIFLLSLKAGGVGINLTAASRVFLMDPAWNPAVEEQCFDRCHRLGQKRDVIITKFIVEDSVEIRMLELQEKKRRLMQGAFGAQKQTAEQIRAGRIQDIKTLLNI